MRRSSRGSSVRPVTSGGSPVIPAGGGRSSIGAPTSGGGSLSCTSMAQQHNDLHARLHAENPNAQGVPFLTNLPTEPGCWTSDTSCDYVGTTLISCHSYWVSRPDSYCQTNGNGLDTGWLRC
jgi:hypothetical protein